MFFFSHSLFLKNYDLIIDRSIIAYHPMTEKTNLSIYLKTIKSQSKIVKTFKKSKIMFYLDVFFFNYFYPFKNIQVIHEKNSHFSF